MMSFNSMDYSGGIDIDSLSEHPGGAERIALGKLALLLVWLVVALALTAFTPTLAAHDELTGLRQLSAGFTDVFRAVSPSVVHIRSELDPLVTESEGIAGGYEPHVIHGSGFVFEPMSSSAGNRRYILTNHHVVENARRIIVRLHDGREFEANITGGDPKSDVAVIDIAATHLQSLQLADSHELQIGQWVLAIGSPFGLKHSLTVGVISGIGRTSLGINDYEDFIQTDASINPGNSGGPLVNLDGHVVGINSAILTRIGGFMGAGFAIPVHLARIIANQLVANGKVNRAYLGILLQTLDSSRSAALGLSDERGALVSRVDLGSPAEAAGLQVGDVIVRYRGKPVRDVGSFIIDLSLTTPGSLVTLAIIRDSKHLTLTATLAARRLYEKPEGGAVSSIPSSNLEATIEDDTSGKTT